MLLRYFLFQMEKKLGIHLIIKWLLVVEGQHKSGMMIQFGPRAATCLFWINIDTEPWLGIINLTGAVKPILSLTQTFHHLEIHCAVNETATSFFLSSSSYFSCRRHFDLFFSSGKCVGIKKIVLESIINRLLLEILLTKLFEFLGEEQKSW